MSIGNIEDLVGAGDVSIGGALDPITGALPVQRVDDPRFDFVNDPDFVSETNKAIGVYHYPDANGLSMLGFDSISFVGEITAVGDTWAVTIEGSNDGTKWDDVTNQFLDGNGAQPPTVISITGGTQQFSLSNSNYDFRLFRMRIEITGTVTANSALVGSYQKAI
jgi:hypothetical protein